MDRRQVLIGMTATGVAGSLNLNDLLSAQSIESVTNRAVQTIPARYAHHFDAEWRTLLGPVKLCVEKTTSDYGKSVKTTEYGPDRKLISTHYERNGQVSSPSSSSSDGAYSEVRDTQGRILKYRNRNREGAVQETSYDYDTEGRLLTISNDQNSDRTEFRYSEDGSKTSVQTFDPKTTEQNQNSACAGSEWDSTTFGDGVPLGGNVTTIYDKNDNPIELQVRSSEGELVTHIVRIYDGEGRLTEDRLLERNMPTSFFKWMSAEQQAEMTPAQLKAYSKGPYALIKKPLGTTYTYDSHNRITKKHERNVIFDETTRVSYNEQGEKIRERKTVKLNSIMPLGPSYSFSFDADGNPIISKSDERPGLPDQAYMPPDTDTRYAYQYDSYGNWTEKIEARDDGFSVTTRRTITYY